MTAARSQEGRGTPALAAIRAAHTAVFFAELASIAWLLVRQRQLRVLRPGGPGQSRDGAAGLGRGGAGCPRSPRPPRADAVRSRRIVGAGVCGRGPRRDPSRRPAPRSRGARAPAALARAALDRGPPLLEVARAYLSLADPAGAGSAVADAERILRRRPGLGVLAEQVAELRLRSRGSAEALAGPSTLTPAELRVLPILSTHRRFDEIAERPQVSRHTVKSHVVSKLGASSRGEAVDLAIEIGLLEPFPGLRLTARAALD